MRQTKKGEYQTEPCKAQDGGDGGDGKRVGRTTRNGMNVKDERNSQQVQRAVEKRSTG